MGARFKDFTMLAADQTLAHSIIVVKNDENKFFKMSENLMMATSGDAGDAMQFAEYVAKNIHLYKIRNEYELSPSAASNFIRRNLAESLRSRDPYHVNLLLGGYDKNLSRSELYNIDYLAAKISVPHTSHGYGGMFCQSIFDQFHNEDASVDEAYELFKKCVKEVHRRQIINLTNFKITYVDKDGIHDLPSITPEVLRDMKTG